MGTKKWIFVLFFFFLLSFQILFLEMQTLAVTRVASFVAVCSAIALMLAVSQRAVGGHGAELYQTTNTNTHVSLLRSRGKCWCWLFAPAVALPSTFLVYLRNCNNCLWICFVSLLFSSDTTLPISYSRTNNSSVGSWGGRSYGCRSGGKLQSCWYVHIYVYIFLCISCLRLLFKHLCVFFVANELGWAALAFATKRACKRPQLSFASFRLSLLRKKLASMCVCSCVCVCVCMCVPVCKCVCVHVCVHVCGTAYPNQLEIHTHTLQCWTTQWADAATLHLLLGGESGGVTATDSRSKLSTSVSTIQIITVLSLLALLVQRYKYWRIRRC